MFYRFSKNVWAWREVIVCVLRDLGLEGRYDVDDILALIHVESAGDPYARRRNSKYFGLTQCYQGYVDEACKQAQIPTFEASALHGDGYLAIWTMLNVFERYAYLHQHHGLRYAILHKGGPGCLNKLVGLVNKRGWTDAQAAQFLSKHWRYSMDHPKPKKRGRLVLPRLWKYARRWHRFEAIYLKRLLAHEAKQQQPQTSLRYWLDPREWESPWESLKQSS
jgi:hypothetical protein